MTPAEAEVAAAAERRARALVDRDADALRRLHYPALRWTTHRGEVLDREAYVRGNTGGALVWRAQRLEDVAVAVAGDAAVLTAVVVDEVEVDGERATNRLRLTQSWVRGADGWVCLAGHASAVPAGAVRIEPWGAGDLPLLTRLNGDPAMMEHLGGPESPERLAERQARYERPREPGAGRMFRIVDEASGEAVGSVGYWERDWNGGRVYETGWAVVPEFQGRGIAGRATALAIDAASAERHHRYLHAFPAVDNPPSNAICRKLGFTLAGECDFEYPAGNPMRCNDWRLDLEAVRRG